MSRNINECGASPSYVLASPGHVFTGYLLKGQLVIVQLSGLRVLADLTQGNGASSWCASCTVPTCQRHMLPGPPRSVSVPGNA